MLIVKNIKLILGTLAVSALLFAGCGKNEAVKAAEEWADAVCKCKDADCAMKASLDGAEKLKKFRDAKGTKADAEAIMKATKKAQECMEEKMKAGGGGAAAPAAPAEGGEAK
jgi:hypothetical protein